MSEVEFDRLLDGDRARAATRLSGPPADARRAAKSRERQRAPLAPDPISPRLVRRLLIAACGTSPGLSNNQCKTLIMLMEATTRIELVYTVLQFA